MPAVDPVRFTRQIEVALQEIGDADRLTLAILDLLAFYTDRTRRPAGTRRAGPARESFGAPRPVMSALALRLRKDLGGDLELTLALSTALWEAGYQETQALAAACLGLRTGAEAADWAEAHARTCDDWGSLRELAGRGLSGWRAADPEGFLVVAGRWVRWEGEQLRAFGLLALAAAVLERSFEDVPAVFRLLAGIQAPARSPVERAMSTLLQALARRSPAETARFLIDAVRAGSPGAVNLVRQSLSAFPERQRAALNRALLEQRQAGIMPTSR